MVFSPAMRFSISVKLSAADQRYDFDFVAGLQAMLAVTAARHDIPIDFDGHEFGRELQVGEQFRDGRVGRNVAGFAIKQNLHEKLPIA
jgi:hypothetical protein